MRSIIGLNPLNHLSYRSLGILFILGWLSVIIEKLIHNVVMVLFFAIPIIAFVIGAIKYAI